MLYLLDADTLITGERQAYPLRRFSIFGNDSAIKRPLATSRCPHPRARFYDGLAPVRPRQNRQGRPRKALPRRLATMPSMPRERISSRSAPPSPTIPSVFCTVESGDWTIPPC